MRQCETESVRISLKHCRALLPASAAVMKANGKTFYRRSPGTNRSYGIVEQSIAGIVGQREIDLGSIDGKNSPSAARA